MDVEMRVVTRARSRLGSGWGLEVRRLTTSQIGPRKKLQLAFLVSTCDGIKTLTHHQAASVLGDVTTQQARDPATHRHRPCPIENPAAGVNPLPPVEETTPRAVV